MWARCTRIWCVRPVLGSTVTAAKPSNRSDHLVERLRRATGRVVAADGHLLALLGMNADRAVDDVAVAVRPPDDQGEILLLDRAGLELRRQLRVRQVGAGHQDHAAGVAVEPVDDARPGRSAAAAQAGAEVKLQGAGQRARPVPARRMHDHARRLVDHHQVLVLVEDLQRDVLRPRRLAGDLRQDDRDPLPGLEAIGRLAAIAVDLDAAGRNHAPQMDPAVVVEMDGQEDVEPLACFRLGDDQLDRIAGKMQSDGRRLVHGEVAPGRAAAVYLGLSAEGGSLAGVSGAGGAAAALSAVFSVVFSSGFAAVFSSGFSGDFFSASPPNEECNFKVGSSGGLSGSTPRGFFVAAGSFAAAALGSNDANRS